MVAPELLRLVLAFFAVLAMIGAAGLIARKLGLASAASGYTNKRRLSVSETLALDGRRRAVIIKCDEREHLIILGATGETVVEHDLDIVEQETEAPAREAPIPLLSSFAKKFREQVKDAA